MKNYKLQYLRNKKHITQEKMSTLLCMPYSTYIKKENGITKFSIQEALEIALILGESVEEIFKEE